MDDVRKYLDMLAGENRLRAIPEEGDGSRVDLLSNDYLGLGAREGEWHEEFMDRYGDAAFTSSASRLLSRRQKYHDMLEERLGELYVRPALLYNSGYHANTGVLSALSALPGTLILSDKLIHASAIDGIRLGGGDYRRFAHNDTASLEKLLERHAANYRHVAVVVESVYSMDGDIAPLRKIAALKKKYANMLLIVDEAHGFGTFGERGLGVLEELDLLYEADIIIGTLGKAAASAGAFAIADGDMRDFLVNTSRSFIFSTAMPPVQQAWSLLMIEKLTAMRREREHLQSLGNLLRKVVEEITGVANPSRSQIVPVMAGDAATAMAWATHLRENGYDCMPIRRPTVPAGTERLRISLNALLGEETIEGVLKSLKEIAR